MSPPDEQVDRERRDRQQIDDADAGFKGLGSVVKATHGMRDEILDEERVIKRLTWCLAVMTAALLVLTVVLVLRGC